MPYIPRDIMRAIITRESLRFELTLGRGWGRLWDRSGRGQSRSSELRGNRE